MVRDRIYGNDVPFSDWCRRMGKQGQLPSVASDGCAVVLTDVDMTVHRYMTPVDKIGTRQLQALMEVEVKTRNGNPTRSQLDTYAKKHVTTRLVTKVGGVQVFNYGISFLSFSGTSPDDSESIRWGRFNKNEPNISWKTIDEDTLVKLLRFDLHPDSLQKHPFRRHHYISDAFTRRKVLPLGFEVEETVVVRS
jgi:hypothetical protein